MDRDRVGKLQIQKIVAFYHGDPLLFKEHGHTFGFLRNGAHDSGLAIHDALAARGSIFHFPGKIVIVAGQNHLVANREFLTVMLKVKKRRALSKLLQLAVQFIDAGHAAPQRGKHLNPVDAVRRVVVRQHIAAELQYAFQHGLLIGRINEHEI